MARDATTLSKSTTQIGPTRQTNTSKSLRHSPLGRSHSGTGNHHPASRSSARLQKSPGTAASRHPSRDSQTPSTTPNQRDSSTVPRAPDVARRRRRDRNSDIPIDPALLPGNHEEQSDSGQEAGDNDGANGGDEFDDDLYNQEFDFAGANRGEESDDSEAAVGTDDELYNDPEPQAPLDHQLGELYEHLKDPNAGHRPTMDRDDRSGYVSLGRSFARRHDPFHRVFALLEASQVNQSQRLLPPTTKDRNLDSLEWRLRFFKELMVFNENLLPTLLSVNRAGLDDIFDLIDQGVKDCRSTDISVLKEAIPTWLSTYEETGDLTTRLKANRGLDHPVTGVFLAPPGITPNELKKRNDLSTVRNEFPMFMWSHLRGKKNEENKYPIPQWNNDWLNNKKVSPFEGFGYSPLLVAAYKRIHISKGAAFDGVTKRLRGRNTEVTWAAIAWAAVALRFALDDELAFTSHQANPLRFDHQYFFCHLLRTFENPNYAGYMNPLRKWWNEKVYPASHEDTSKEELGGTLGAMNDFVGNAE